MPPSRLTCGSLRLCGAADEKAGCCAEGWGNRGNRTTLQKTSSVKGQSEDPVFSALSRTHYKARFGPIKLLFAHHSALYAAKGPGNENATGSPALEIQAFGIKPQQGLSCAKPINAKRPGLSPAVAIKTRESNPAISLRSAEAAGYRKASSDRRSRQPARCPSECRQSPSPCRERSPSDCR